MDRSDRSSQRDLFPAGSRTEGASSSPADGFMLSAAESARLLAEHSHAAQYILDAASQRFIEINPAFERLTGYTRAEILTKGLRAEQIVAPQSLAFYRQKGKARIEQKTDRYALVLRTKSGEAKHVEVSVTRLILEGRELVVGSARDVTERDRMEQRLWEKIGDLGHANNRIFALTEKLRRVPELASDLLHFTELKDLFAHAGRTLCAREGFQYLSVSFYLSRQETLDLVYEVGGEGADRDEPERVAKILRVFHGEVPSIITDQEATLPLKGRERTLGVMVVAFHSKELELMRASERALKGYLDLLEALADMIGLLIENIILYERVRQQAVMDPLTGVYNRRFFDAKIIDEVHRSRRYQRDLSLIMIDLDHFKEVNNTLGHPQGDSILSEVGKLFHKHTREVDFVCRYGGDEFVIILPETGYEGAQRKAEALRQFMVDHPFRNIVNEGATVPLGCSIGFGSIDASIRDEREFLRRVDEALFRAKRAGRNRVCGVRQDIPPASKGTTQG